MDAVCKAVKWQILTAYAGPGAPVPTQDYCQDDYAMQGFCQGWNANSQRFNPYTSFKVRQIDVRICQRETTRKGPLKVKLTEATGNCWAEPILFEADLYSLDLPIPGSTDWTSLAVDSVQINNGTLYRIVVHTVSPWYWWDGSQWVLNNSLAALYWWRSTDNNCYTRGRGQHGCNIGGSSGSWINDNWDMNFRLYE